MANSFGTLQQLNRKRNATCDCIHQAISKTHNDRISGSKIGVFERSKCICSGGSQREGEYFGIQSSLLVESEFSFFTVWKSFSWPIRWKIIESCVKFVGEK